MDNLQTIMADTETVNPKHFVNKTELVGWLEYQSAKLHEQYRKSTVADTFDRVVEYISKMRDESLTEYAERIEQALQDKETKAIERHEPIMLKSPITKSVWRCGTCMERVERHDKYCKSCGRAITEWEEHDE